MSTQKQIEASRINGAKSQGPVTPEGKQTSSVNAMAAALWRQLRVWGFEKFSVDRDISNRNGTAWHTVPLSYLSPDEKIATLLRYETAYSRQFQGTQHAQGAPFRHRSAGAGAHRSYLRNSLSVNTIVFSKRTWERLIPMESYKRESILGHTRECKTNLEMRTTLVPACP